MTPLKSAMRTVEPIGKVIGTSAGQNNLVSRPVVTGIISPSMPKMPPTDPARGLIPEPENLGKILDAFG